MKTLLVTAFCLVVGFFPVLKTTAQNSQFKNVEVKLSLERTPKFSISNTPNSSSSGAGKWLLVELSYTPPKLALASNSYRWLDEPGIEAEVIFPAYYNGQNVMALLSGKVVYWSIPLDGKKHYSLLLVPPQIITRYSRPGKKLKESDIIARLSMYTRERQLLLRAFNDKMSFSENQANRLISQLAAPVSTALRLPNTVLSRNRTPWAWIDYDRYNLIKDEIGAK